MNSPVQEDFEQELVIRWSIGQIDAWPELALLHHIPNGGKRGKAEAAKLKRMGVKPGVPDLHLPIARGGFHGLYVEMKRLDGGRVSSEQRVWLAALYLVRRPSLHAKQTGFQAPCGGEGGPSHGPARSPDRRFRVCP